MLLIVLFLVGLLAMFALEDAPKRKKENHLKKTQPFSKKRNLFPI